MSIERSRSHSLRLLGAFAAVYLLWGATFLAIRYAVAEIPPLATIAIRCAGGALILFLWLLARGKLERTTRAQWFTASVAGTLLFLGCHAILASAEQRISSGQAALLMTSIPFSLVVLGALESRQRPSLPVIAGLVVGIAGIALLAGHDSSGTIGDRVAVGFGGVLWAVGSKLGRDGARPTSAIQGSAMQLAAGAGVLTIVSLAYGESADWLTAGISTRASLALVFLVICGTVIGFAAYTWLLTVTTPAAAGSYAFVNPIVALILAWIAGDEAPSVRTAVAATLVIGAVILTRDREARTRA